MATSEKKTTTAPLSPKTKSKILAETEKSLKETHDMFLYNKAYGRIPEPPGYMKESIKRKIMEEYEPYIHEKFEINKGKRLKILKRLGVTSTNAQEQKLEEGGFANKGVSRKRKKLGEGDEEKKVPPQSALGEIIKGIDEEQGISKRTPEEFLVEKTKGSSNWALMKVLENAKYSVELRKERIVYPEWHAPWKLMRVISGHQGWVRSLYVDPGNEWFVSGSSDRTIKFWDLATGQLKITFTGHISAVRGLAVSARHPYMFSCGEDKKALCWDLEQNKVIRSYHGHLSGIYALSLHPTLDLIITGSRDSTARVWDIRTKAAVHILSGHDSTISSIISQADEPQIITGSQDTTVKLWDLGTAAPISTLTNHKKGVRALALHSQEYTFVSGGADKLRIWSCPKGVHLRSLEGHNSIINALALNHDGVLASGGDNGSLYLWDYKSGYNFQTIQSLVQPGSLSCEASIYAMSFDRSSMRLITAECDKTIKIWKEDEEATKATHPITDFNPYKK